MKIYNIPFGLSLVDEISKYLLNEVGQDGDLLATYTILCPNLRLIKNMQMAFLNNSQGKSIILPKMISIENTDYFLNDFDLLTQNDDFKINNDVFKPTVSKNKRTFILSKLISKKDSKLSILQAINMAEQLGELIDTSHRENIDFNDIGKIIDANLAIHWQEIVKFLDIATIAWKNILLEQNMVDEAYKQILIYKMQTALWNQSPPVDNIISLNLNSYYDYIINMNKTIAQLPNGKLITHGIDIRHIQNSENLPFYHPQKIHQYMINKYNDKNLSVVNLVPNQNNIKEKFIHTLFDNEIYKDFKNDEIESLINDLSLITTKNEELEAKTIALILRETLETPSKTAGIITNNPSLIKRIKNELEKWNISINNYLGESLLDTPHAQLFIQISHVLQNNFEPNSFLALLRQPYFQMGHITKEKINSLVDILDLKFLREPWYNGGLLEILVNVKKDTNNKELYDFLLQINNFFKDMLEIAGNPSKKINFSDTLVSHIKICQYLSSTADNNALIWSQQEGKELSLLLSSLLLDSQELPPMEFIDYHNILLQILHASSITQIYNKHPRLFIYGNMQSLGINHDTMIISNLNEGSLPYYNINNPWLNNYLIHSLNMLPLDASIGIGANHFCQVFGSKEVILIRSEKEKGNPTSPSRWFLKIDTALQYYEKFNINNKKNLTNIAEKLYTHITKPSNIETIPIPYFVNPEIIPTSISATKIEDLIKNPYIFFIKDILKIKPLENINPQTQGKEVGTRIHKVLEDLYIYINNSTKQASYQEIISHLNNLTSKEFHNLNHDIMFKIFKMPAIENTLHNFVEYNLITNNHNINNIYKHHIEESGEITYILNDEKSIIIKSKADRITIGNNNIDIVDYKTNNTFVIADYHKQLYIITLVLMNGGFKNIKIDLSKINNINANYILLPKSFSKAISTKEVEGILDTIDDFNVQLKTLLQSYFIDYQNYNWSNHKNIDDNHLHFARFLEFSNNFDDIIEDSTQGDSDE